MSNAIDKETTDGMNELIERISRRIDGEGAKHVGYPKTLEGIEKEFIGNQERDAHNRSLMIKEMEVSGMLEALTLIPRIEELMAVAGHKMAEILRDLDRIKGVNKERIEADPSLQTVERMRAHDNLFDIFVQYCHLCLDSGSSKAQLLAERKKLEEERDGKQN